MRSVLVVAVSFVIASAQAMTDRFYFNQDVKSPNGKWRMTAISPDNAGGRPGPFARNFTYTLYEVQTGNAIWSRKQGENEGSPLAVFVNDEGRVVIRSAREDLIVLDPRTGEETLNCGIFAQFPEAEAKRHIAWSTAGPIWESGAHWYFHQAAEESYFVLRTRWGRRVIVRLDEPAIVNEPTEAFIKSLRPSEVNCVVDIFTRASAGPDAISDAYKREPHQVTPWAVLDAIRMAVDLELTESVPAIAKVQRSEYIGRTGSLFDEGERYYAAAEAILRSRTLTIRQASHFALRRLNAKPEPLTVIEFAMGGAVAVPFHGAPFDGPRADRVDQLEAGMSVTTVLDTLGAPDHLNSELLAWEYDMDAEDPFTLRVRFDEISKTVSEWERIDPPLWKTGERATQVFPSDFW